MATKDPMEKYRALGYAEKGDSPAPKPAAKTKGPRQLSVGEMKRRDEPEAKKIGVREVNPDLPKLKPNTRINYAPDLPYGYDYTQKRVKVTDIEPALKLSPKAYEGGRVDVDLGRWPPVKVDLPKVKETVVADRIRSYDPGDNVANPPYRKKGAKSRFAPKPLVSSR